jgi:hypothetical protein
MGHETQHDAAGDAVVTRPHEIGPRHGRIEIEQDGDRFLKPLLVRAVLLADEGAQGRELMEQSNLPSTGKRASESGHEAH